MKIEDIIKSKRGKVFVTGDEKNTYILSVKTEFDNENEIATIYPSLSKLNVSKEFFDRVVNLDDEDEFLSSIEKKQINTLFNNIVKVTNESELPSYVLSYVATNLTPIYKKLNSSNKYLHINLDFIGNFDTIKSNILEA